MTHIEKREFSLTSSRGQSSPSPVIVDLKSLDVLWFQVGGTVCNLACKHCFVSCSPTNHTHEFMSLDLVESYLDDALQLGVKEYYLTGGEPFLNPEIEQIIKSTISCGPVTVLTNGLLLSKDRCRRLHLLTKDAQYSFDLRISLDGCDPESNDSIRGAGTFDRILKSAATASDLGLNPVITMTEVDRANATNLSRRRIIEKLQEYGISQPRLKLLPVFKIGAEAKRNGTYQNWQKLVETDLYLDAEQLQCGSCRMVTDLGVWVCPILVNEPTGKLGTTISETLHGYPAAHSACWTCYMENVSCRT